MGFNRQQRYQEIQRQYNVIIECIRRQKTANAYNPTEIESLARRWSSDIRELLGNERYMAALNGCRSVPRVTTLTESENFVRELNEQLARIKKVEDSRQISDLLRLGQDFARGAESVKVWKGRYEEWVEEVDERFRNEYGRDDFADEWLQLVEISEYGNGATDQKDREQLWGAFDARIRWLKKILRQRSQANHGLQQLTDPEPALPPRRRELDVSSVRPNPIRFRVALSFAGENRSFVAKVAAVLKLNLGDTVFYDEWFKAELARPDLDTYLQNIYHNESELIVVFLCSDYDRKEWCGLEWRAIRDLIKKKRHEQIMPFRFDQTEINGLFSIDGYISAEKMAPEEAADLILERLRSISLKSDKMALPESLRIVNASRDWVLIGEKLFRSQKVTMHGTQSLTVILRTSDCEEDAAIAMLRPQKWEGRPLPFAFRNEAWLTRVTSANSESQGHDNIWTVELSIEQLDYGGNALTEIATTGYTADDIAKLRAGRILLNSPAKPAKLAMEKAILEGLITGMNTPVHANHCPILKLWKSWNGVEEDFLACARLLSVFYLKLTYTVEHIQELSLGPIERKKQLHIRFRGIRKKIFTNQDATKIEVSGICNLVSN